MDNISDSNDYILKINPNEYLPLRDVVFKAIRSAILAGELKPGSRLTEKQLAEQVGVSRTPVREALRKLETEGFVEMSPRKGAIVSIINEKGIKDVLEVRAILEALAARLACRNGTKELVSKLAKLKEDFEALADNRAEDFGDLRENRSLFDALAGKDVEFHGLIFAASENDKLIQIINNLREQIHRYRLAYLKDKNAIEQIKADHNDILTAIASHDEASAGEAASRHIRNQEIAVINSLRGKENII